MADVAECGFKQRVTKFLRTEAVSAKEISNTWITICRDHVHSFATINQWVVQFKNSTSEITYKRCCGTPFSAESASTSESPNFVSIDFYQSKDETINTTRSQKGAQIAGSCKLA